jgi:hypothetical protein
MRVIFLDVDGVLNSERFGRTLDEQHRQLGHHAVCECFRLTRQIDRVAVARLNRLIAETGAKIVVSSTWRKLLDPPELHRVLVEHGLVAEIIGETPDGPNDPEMLAAYGHIDRVFRGHEIDAWLGKHPEVESFVILDDNSDMEMHKNRLVQTDCEEGLLDEHVDLAICVLSWDGKTIPSPIDALMDEMERASGVGPGELPGSSVGISCQEESCVERLTLERTTTLDPTHDDDYRNLMPALDEAALFLGWRLFRCRHMCPTHVLSLKLACARCLMPCPDCSCMGGPRFDAVDGEGGSR